MAGSRPLAGLRVLDLSRVVSGPLCGRMLADLGADVIKVEPPEGDSTRRVPPFVEGVSVYFAQMNAGKRNVGIDLKAPGAPALVARLAASVDVLIENFRPGVLARFGLDEATLRAANPRLVYCSITGWGQDGPWHDRRAYAPLVHADAGMLELSARLRGRRPEPEVHQHADVYSAVMATNAVLAALVQRAVTGAGQHLDVAMGQVALYVNEWAAVQLQPEQDDWGGFDTWHHHAYPLGDGSFITLVGNPERLFPTWVLRLGGDPSLLDDPRFATAAARAGHVPEMVSVLDSLTRRFADAAAISAVLDDTELLWAPLRSVARLAATEWATRRGLTADVRPGLAVPAAPWRTSVAEIGPAPLVAERGEHNADVLRSFGLTDAEIDELSLAHVLHC